jgi:ELWxxDGT repeat protein
MFTADDGVSGRELWISDGTGPGTLLVKDVRPGSDSSSLGELTSVNGTLFFVANDGVSGVELWKSDRTGLGTVLVKDLRTGSDSSSPSELTNVNGTLFFAADDGVNGIEVWKTSSATPVFTGSGGGCFIASATGNGASSMSLLLSLLLLTVAGIGYTIRRLSRPDRIGESSTLPPFLRAGDHLIRNSR